MLISKLYIKGNQIVGYVSHSRDGAIYRQLNTLQKHVIYWLGPNKIGEDGLFRREKSVLLTSKKKSV